MTQYFTDFSDNTVGNFPSDWTNNSALSPVIESSSTSSGKVFYASGTGSTLDWTGANWTGGPSAQDIEVVGKMKTNKDTGAGCYVGLRMGESGGLSTGYICGHSTPNSNEIALDELSDGSVSSIATYSTSAIDYQSWFWIRLRASGTTIQSKVWQDGDSEPDNWHIDATGSKHTSGYAGFAFYEFRADSDWDVLGVGTGGDLAPTSPPTSISPSLSSSSTISNTISVSSIEKSISGKVENKDGIALDGKTIVAIEHNTSNVYTETTDQNGQFSFTNLPAGEYHVYVRGYTTPSKHGIQVN